MIHATEGPRSRLSRRPATSSGKDRFAGKVTALDEGDNDKAAFAPLRQHGQFDRKGFKLVV